MERIIDKDDITIADFLSAQSNTIEHIVLLSVQSSTSEEKVIHVPVNALLSPKDAEKEAVKVFSVPVDTGKEDKWYEVTAFGNVISVLVTKDEEVVRSWVEFVKSEFVKSGPSIGNYIGLEFEYDFEASHIGTVQLCVRKHCLVYRIPESLRRLPMDIDEGYYMVGASVSSKVELLKFKLGLPYYVDTELPGTPDSNTIGLSALTTKLCSIEIVGLTGNWARSDDLSIEQVHHASVHAYLNLIYGMWISPPPSCYFE